MNRGRVSSRITSRGVGSPPVIKRITSGSPSRPHRSSTSASVNRRRTSRSVSRSTSIVRSLPGRGGRRAPGRSPGVSLARLPLDVTLYGVVGGVDIGGQPLGAGALLRVGEPVRVKLLDELPALAVHLIHRYARHEAETLVGGEHVRGILQRGEGPRGGPPAGAVSCGLIPAAPGRRRARGTPTLGAAALFGTTHLCLGAAEGGLERD